MAELDGEPYVLRELQPIEDRLELESLARSGRFENALSTMATVVASAHLRSGGRQGAAIADDWIAFGEKTGWIDRISRYSARYMKTVVKDWRRFCKDLG
jgi:hypothetical protein